MGNLDSVFNPPDRQDEFTAYLRDCGYVGAQRLDDGSYAVLIRLLTTLAIAFDADAVGHGRRYCFVDTAQCLAEWEAMTTRDYVPAGWIAKRPEDPED